MQEYDAQRQPKFKPSTGDKKLIRNVKEQSYKYLDILLENNIKTIAKFHIDQIELLIYQAIDDDGIHRNSAISDHLNLRTEKNYLVWEILQKMVSDGRLHKKEQNYLIV